MARKPNYDFEKRRKELDRKAEKEEKQRRKREKSAIQREQSRTPEQQDAETLGTPSAESSDESLPDR